MTTAIYLPVTREGHFTFLCQVVLTSNKRVIQPGTVGTLRQLKKRFPYVKFEDGPIDKEIDMGTGEIIDAAVFNMEDYNV